jgi:hypothetical protein
MKIGFQPIDDGNWIAGKVYLRNLIHAIEQAKDKEVEVCLISLKGRNVADFLVGSEPHSCVQYEPLYSGVRHGSLMGYISGCG